MWIDTYQCFLIFKTRNCIRIKTIIMRIIGFKRLLVPFEFDANYNNSLKIAELIAIKSGASITILHVLNPILNSGRSVIANGNLCVDNYRKLVENRKNEIRSFLLDMELPMQRVEIRVEVGDYNSCITELLKTNNYDLVFVPDFCKTPLERLLGSINPLDIMERTKTPVIAVNKIKYRFNLKKIILPIRNIKNWHDKIPYTASLAKITGAKIYVLGVGNTASKGIISKVEQQLKYCDDFFSNHNLNYEIDSVFSHGDPAYDVISLAIQKKADLISVSPPVNYFKLQSYFNNNFYNKITSNIDIPVMGITLI